MGYAARFPRVEIWANPELVSLEGPGKLCKYLGCYTVLRADVGGEILPPKGFGLILSGRVCNLPVEMCNWIKAAAIEVEKGVDLICLMRRFQGMGLLEYKQV